MPKIVPRLQGIEDHLWLLTSVTKKLAKLVKTSGGILTNSLEIDFLLHKISWLTNLKKLWKVNSQASSNRNCFSISIGSQLVHIDWKTCAHYWHLTLAAPDLNVFGKIGFIFRFTLMYVLLKVLWLLLSISELVSDSFYIHMYKIRL